MSDTSAALLIAFLIISVLCALIAYTVKRLGTTAPGRLTAVIAAIVALVGVLPTLVLSLRGPDTTSPAAPKTTADPAPPTTPTAGTTARPHTGPAQW
ncbi:MAG TPA: hypothetical protein VLH10_14150 [Yinghuangia sp.]|nr:hypothetical protein [Yinghuangia sp.]